MMRYGLRVGVSTLHSSIAHLPPSVISDLSYKPVFIVGRIDFIVERHFQKQL